MADLSYNDLQRAIQDGLNDVRHSLQQISHDVSNTEHQSQRIDEIDRNIQELKVRFTAIEQFAQQMSSYLQSKFQEDQENSRYRRI